MNRRAVLELSRRHGVHWSCAARHRDAAFSPVVAGVPRRSFRSSFVPLDSSDPPPASGPNDHASNSSPATPRPKFGARWGTRQTQTPAGLSPAEQAMRDAILAKQAASQTSARPTQTPAGLSPAEQATRDAILAKQATSQSQRQQSPLLTQLQKSTENLPRKAHSTKNSQGEPTKDWRCHHCGIVNYRRNMTCHRCVTPFKEQDKRGGRWTCPDCRYRVYPFFKACPKCKAPKPGHHEPTKRAQKSDQTIKIRMLGADLLAEAKGGDINPSALSAQQGVKEPRGEETDPFALDKPADLSPRELAQRRWMQRKGLLPSDERQRPATSETSADEPAEEGEVSTESGRGRRSRKREAKAEEDESLSEEIEYNSDKTKVSKRPKNIRHREVEVEEDFDDERRTRREERKRLKKEKARQKEMDAAPSPLYLPEFISVGNLADVIGVRPAQFVERMEEMGFEDVVYEHVLDAETAGLVAAEYNFEPIFDTPAEDLMAAPEPEDKSTLPARPPVVTIMGHVDHGKTTILDWLRKSSIAASEHGGITQHIGAFSVAMPSGKTITFLDTPGHSAFLEMRRRGADVTDIVVLVVAADDSVKPQTIEAIKHATGANVPVIVAISKIDKEGANLDKVKQDLSLHNVHVEDYGGDVQAVAVSGKTGQGMLELEEAIVTLSEVLDHRADIQGNVEGWVIEATTKSYGRVTTMLIRRGTLRPGDIIVAGTAWARVRTLRNEAGVIIKEATPGMPVEVDGWREQPDAGTEFLQAEDEQQAKEVVENRLERTETQKLSQDATAINQARREVLEKRRIQESEDKELDVDEARSGPKAVPFIIKADVGGSAEAVLNSVTAIGNNEVYANVLRSGVGPVGEFDVEHAKAAKGHLISFNMPIDPAMVRMAELRGVRIMDHNVIYKLIDDVKGALSEHLAPTVTQHVTGEAEIGQVFEISLKGRDKTSIAGCKVRNGVINRARKVRVLRNRDIIYDGSITSLKNIKKDVTEMRKDTECGIGFEGFTNFAVGDHVQCYEEHSEKRHL